MNLSPAYHLRPNKTVERFLFVELLRRMDRILPRPVGDYIYVGLGGPYLEDFNLIHALFGNQGMISLEVESHILSRQRLNQPHSRIALTLDSTRQFTDEFTPKRTPFLVWFDYESARWKNQLAECCDLLQKLPSMSIFKITLPGSTLWLGQTDNSAKAEKLSEEFGDYGPFTAADVNRRAICGTLHRICRRAIAEAVPDTKQRCVRSLASYRYDDGTPILTVTMIVGQSDRIDKAMVASKMTEWPFAALNWQGPREINVPPLSVREKLAVDQLLPDASARTVIRKLKLRFAQKYPESVKVMENYVQLYRQVPQFMRVSL